ncbi:MAG: DNA recombination protein RmuC [Candidatus Doudnabacteria bacterium]|nr:DNA recombination protein RmuC [Candidatus Doudnabacteria bacterium]
MNIEILVIVILVAGFAGLAYLFTRKPKADQSQQILLEWLKEMRGSSENMQKRIDETNKAINERLDNAAKIIGGISKELGQMNEIGRDMKKVQEFLVSPKRRGGLGEEVLASLLEQYFPQSEFALQYRFKSGEVVDAIIKVQGKLLTIDSKFSMENYRDFISAEAETAREAARKAFLRDIKKRIDEIHKKYILPEEGTFDFAMMYVPSEAVFYEIINDDSLTEYARSKRVYVASPNSFMHYLQIIMLSLRGQKINEAANQIMGMIAAIRQDSDKFGRNLEVLSRHVTNAKNTSDTAVTDYAQLKGKIEQVSSLRIETSAGRAEDKLLESRS